MVWLLLLLTWQRRPEPALPRLRAQADFWGVQLFSDESEIVSM